MLGAYRASTDFTTVLISEFNLLKEKMLKLVQSKSTDKDIEKKFSTFHKNWTLSRGRKISDIMVEDYNKKYSDKGTTGPRGVIKPVFEFKMLRKSSKPDERIMGGYSFVSHNVYVYPHSSYDVFMDIKEIVNKVDYIKNKEEFLSIFLSALMMNIILHETLHHIQTFDLINQDIFFFDPRKFQDKYHNYRVNNLEIPAFSIGTAFLMSVIVPRKYYVFSNSNTLIDWINSNDLDEIFDIYDSFTMFTIDPSYQVSDEYLKKVKSVFEIAQSSYRYDQNMSFEEYLKSRIKYSLKNFNRYLTQFDPLNSAMNDSIVKAYSE